MKKPLTLIILDGWGYRPEAKYNPTVSANTPTIDALFRDYPHTLLEASGSAVGLPEGQMGNSEVGHLHLGAGRLIPQSLARINNAIIDGTLAQHPAVLAAIAQAKSTGKAIHVLGLLSPGGVHSHEAHIIALLSILLSAGTQTYLHAFLDGRDTPPQSAASSLTACEAEFKKHAHGNIASIIGRYYAMDRDNRWERIESAYRLLVEAQAPFSAPSATDALAAAYARGENDEFVKATVIGKGQRIETGDIVIFMNFRGDRAREISEALTAETFPHFKRDNRPVLAEFMTLSAYSDTIKSTVLFPTEIPENTLGDVIEKAGLTQLRIAETEKYAHVTYFFNGGLEAPFAHESRTLIPSPKVATYDLQPDMSAQALTEKLVAAIESCAYDVIICNYANPDMVGHTGDQAAAEFAMCTIDSCLNAVISATQSVSGELLITADHGNVECMFNEKTQQAHTAHTNNLVPFIFVGRAATLRTGGSLCDIAPTMLALLGIKQPLDMTGRNLLDTA